MSYSPAGIKPENGEAYLKRLGRSVKNQKDYTNHKGFTLVELIVVIVILAILAAILIPGLLKWIDHAKKKQYELEARSIYLATEASLMELYTWGFEGTGKKDDNGVIIEESKGKPWDLTTIEEGHFTIRQDNPAWFQYVKEMSGIEDIEYLRCYIAKGRLKALIIRDKSPSADKRIQATIKDKDADYYNNYIIKNLPKSSWGTWEWSDDGSWNIEVLPEP